MPYKGAYKKLVFNQTFVIRLSQLVFIQSSYRYFMEPSTIESYIKSRMPDKVDIHVSQMAEITDGWETEIYSFDAESSKDGMKSVEKLVLRMYSGPWAHYKARKEFDLLKRLHAAGYPVPEVPLIEEDSTPLGRPFIIMQRIEGSAMWSLMESDEGSRFSELMHLFSKLFHDLHKLDWRLLVEDPKEVQGLDSKEATKRWIEKYEKRVKEIGRPELLDIVDWLKREIDRVTFAELSPTHNDFHPNNILIDETGNPFVIDWTAADLLDYRVDIAWTLLLAKVYVGDSLGDAMLKEYEDVSKKAVEDIDFFEVIGSLRRLTDILVSLNVDSEEIGLREGATDLIREQLDQNLALLDIVKNHTGMDLPKIRELMNREKP